MEYARRICWIDVI